MPATANGVKSRLSRLPRWSLWLGAAVVLGAAAFLVLRHQGAAGSDAGSLDTSGTPGPAATGQGSLAQQPTGGASSIPANLPPIILSEPDTLQQQVQDTPAGSDESPSSLGVGSIADQDAAAIRATAANGTPTMALGDPLEHLNDVAYSSGAAIAASIGAPQPAPLPEYRGITSGPGTAQWAGAALAASQGVQWGGQTFTTKAGIASWLSDHGANYTTWAKNHPAAASQLS